MKANEQSKTSANPPWDWSMYLHRHLIQHYTTKVPYEKPKRVTLTGLKLWVFLCHVSGSVVFIQHLRQNTRNLHHQSVTIRLSEQHVNQTGQKISESHTVIIAKMIITLIYMNDELHPDTWPGAGVHPQVCRAVRYHSNRRWAGKSWVKWFSTWCSDMLQSISPVMSSCVSEMTSALQALEVGFLQDAVDLQVGHRVCGTTQIGSVAGAEGTAGARGALTATAPGCMFGTADAAAALTVGRLRVPRIPAWLRRERMSSARPLGLGHQVATLLITIAALPFSVFSQHMMTLNQSRRASFVFCPGWTTRPRLLTDSVDGLLQP